MKILITLFILISIIVLNANSQPINEMQKLLPADGAEDDYFGMNLSISGNYAIIGAKADDDNGSSSGSAYIYHFNGSTWEETAKLKPSDGVGGDEFGTTVAISGNYAIVGAWMDDDNGTSSGSAYIFSKSSGTWQQYAKLKPTDGAADEYFGNSIHIDGNYAIIGAIWDDVNGEKSGSAYIFHNNGGIWEQMAKLIPSDGAAEERFGISVKTNGNYAIVGAYRDDDNGPNSGSAYIFYNNEGSWEEFDKLTASDGEENDYFGISTDITNEYAIVGCWFDSINNAATGSVYIYYNNNGTWEEQDKLFASDGEDNDQFGNTVSINENYILVGADGDDDNGENSGAAYIFQNQSGTWNEVRKLLASDGEEGDDFGGRVCLSDNFALVGAWANDDNGSRSGSAYIFDLEDVGIEMIKNHDINIYPNPSIGKFYLESNILKIKSIIVNDITGRIIIKKEYINPKEEMIYTLNLSEFENGIYIINIYTGKSIYSSKIVKQ